MSHPSQVQTTFGAATTTAGIAPVTAADIETARRAASSFFLLLGIAASTWAALVPFTKAGLGLNDRSLGGVLFVLGIGTIAATLSATALVRRFGSRATLTLAGVGLSIVLPFMAAAPSVAVLSIVLFVFGVCAGLTGVTANAQAIVVQAKSGRPIMSSFHALFSVGGLVGAGASSLALRLGMSIESWTIVVATSLLALAAMQQRGLLREREDRATPAPPIRLPAIAVLVVGLMTMAMYLAEGAVLDWSAVFLHEVRAYAVSTAALGYAAFSIAMAVGRLLGDRIVERLGPVAVVRFGGGIAALGFLVLVVVPWPPAGLLGCALIGLGASNVVPTLISQSAQVSSMPTAAAVSAVAAMGTIGLLAGPALIGFLAHATSLTIALAALAGLMCAVGLASHAVRGRETG
jgi:fucose permease